MTDTLILDSLDIKNFRTFRHLQIERLGRVNLVVGKNNVGKTSLLEALWLYVNSGSLTKIRDLFESRGERYLLPIRKMQSSSEEHTIQYLFHGRNSIDTETEPIIIGPSTADDLTLLLEIVWYIENGVNEQGNKQFKLLQPPDDDIAVDELIPGLAVKLGDQRIINYLLYQDVGRIDRVHSSSKLKGIRCVFVPANGLDNNHLAQLWDSIALTNLEEDILSALCIVEPKVERINLVGTPEQNGMRLPVAKVVGIDTPLSLRSLGEGLSRMFGLALALVNAKDGLLLIDEVESGLHYSVQPDMWRLIFEVARRLNVQVFATTHSWDCIEAFQQAAQENDQTEGVLISLRRKKKQEDEIVAVLLDERQMSIATKEQIEIR